MKKILKIIGIGIASIVIFIAGIVVASKIAEPDPEETFIPYIREAVPRFTTWDIEEYRALMSERGFNSTSPEQWTKLFKMFERLGEYQTHYQPSPEFSKTMITTSRGPFTTAIYLVPIMFDTGQAHVRLTLEYDDGEVKAVGVRFLSDLFLE